MCSGFCFADSERSFLKNEHDIDHNKNKNSLMRTNVDFSLLKSTFLFNTSAKF